MGIFDFAYGMIKENDYRLHYFAGARFSTPRESVGYFC
jgi:hypothetical protein